MPPGALAMTASAIGASTSSSPGRPEARYRRLPTTNGVDRKYHTLDTAPDGSVVSFGGLVSGGRGDEREGKPVADVLRLDPETGEWRTVATQGGPSPRNEPCGAIIGSAFWVFGGSLEGESGGQGESCDELWRFDLDSAEWERVRAAGGPSARCASGCACSGASLYVFGGGGIAPGRTDGATMPELSDAFAFDTEQRVWRELRPQQGSAAPVGRSLPQIAVPGGGDELFLFGGFSRGHRLNDTWVLSLESCSWAELPVPEVERPVPRSCHAGVVVQGGSHWVIVGGRVGFGATATAHLHGKELVDTHDASDVWSFSFAERRWRELSVGGDGPGPRRSHGMTVVRRGGAERLLVYGGRSEGRPVLSSTYELTIEALRG